MIFKYFYEIFLIMTVYIGLESTASRCHQRDCSEKCLCSKQVGKRPNNLLMRLLNNHGRFLLENKALLE